MNQPHRLGQSAPAVAALTAVLLMGCQNGQSPASGTQVSTAPSARHPTPAPLHLLLPQAIRIHPFTGTRVFGEAGGVTGIDVRIEAIDGYGDANKAFGHFRFELFRHRPTAADPKGERLAVWNVTVTDPQDNRRHWNSITRTYQFKLGWEESVPIGHKFVLLAVFESPFTARLFDQRVFISGQ